MVDGYLNIDIDGGFVPALGNTFNIITGNAVSGAFDYYDVSGMPAGLTFHINYLSNAARLQVVNKPIFSADFDHDGDVDLTGYSIWRAAFDLTTLGDANGDNVSNAADYVLWRKQSGSTPGAGALAGGAVPEPASATLLAISVTALVGQRRYARRLERLENRSRILPALRGEKMLLPNHRSLKSRSSAHRITAKNRPASRINNSRRLVYHCRLPIHSHGGARSDHYWTIHPLSFCRTK